MSPLSRLILDPRLRGDDGTEECLNAANRHAKKEQTTSSGYKLLFWAIE